MVRSEQREAAQTLSTQSLWIRAGFRVITTDPLAGGPIELAFFVENLTAHALGLAVGGDRMRQRPAQFHFEASIQGRKLEDPMAAQPYFGGPQTVVEVAANAPWHQPLLLNQFLCLEVAPDLMGRDQDGFMDLTCSRPITLATTDAVAFTPKDEQTLTVDLCISLRRDADALAALNRSLLDKTMSGPPSLRERPLAMLLAMRSAARPQIEALTRHSDAQVVTRAAQTLAMMK